MVYSNVKHLLILCLWILATTVNAQQSIRVMTYNIKYDAQHETDNNWEVRKPWVLEILQYEKPQILGIQEALLHQVEDIQGALSGYLRVGVGRDDGKNAGEFSTIYFDAGEFDLKDQGTFWLSESPDKVSKGWDAALPRIATYVVLEAGNREDFVVYNAHLDHRGEESRRESISLILAHRASNFPDMPVIVMGDFNFQDDDPAYESLKTANLLDSRTAAKVYGPKETFNGFNWDKVPEVRIDYIFAGNFEIITHAVITTSQPNRYPSDHFPVVAELEFNEK